MFRSVVSAIQFQQGADRLWACVMKHPQVMQELFVYRLVRKLSFKIIWSPYDIVWSSDGSNQKAQEEVTVYSLEFCLQTLKGKEALGRYYCFLVTHISFRCARYKKHIKAKWGRDVLEAFHVNMSPETETEALKPTTEVFISLPVARPICSSTMQGWDLDVHMRSAKWCFKFRKVSHKNIL